VGAASPRARRKRDPSFNAPGEARGRFCKEHLLPGMENVKAKQCETNGCMRQPTFNAPGETRGRFCKEHRLPDMENVKSKRCEATGCKRQPAFNAPGEACGRFCAEHQLPGMEDVLSKRCETSGCVRGPSFNVPGETRGRFCKEHRLPGMEDIKSKRCEASGCQSLNPGFNAPGETRGRFCGKHRLPGMEDVVSKRCEECTRQPDFNVPGHPASHCSDHKQPSMIRNPRVRCTHPSKCKEWSTHGRTGPLRCEAHSLQTDTNLVEKACCSCGVTMILSGSGHCEFCDPGAARKRRRLAKQDEVKHFLAVKMPQHPPNSTDRTPAELLACGDRERPDFLWDRGHLVVILEVDEDQHMGRACECEQARMINISQVMAAPHTLWIRYNPDKYTSSGAQLKPGVRRDTLRRVLLWAIEASPETCAAWPVIGVTQLFFDGFLPVQADEIQSLDHFIL